MKAKRKLSADFADYTDSRTEAGGSSQKHTSLAAAASCLLCLCNREIGG